MLQVLFKKNIALLIFFACLINYGQTQESISRKGKRLSFKVIESKDDVSINEILNLKNQFLPPDNFSQKTTPKNFYWIQIDLKNEINTISKDSIWYLRLTNFEYATLYFNENEKIAQKKVGRFENNQNKKSIIYSNGIPFNKGSLINNRYLYLKVKRVTFFGNIANWRFSYVSPFKESLIKSFYSLNNLKMLIPIYLFSGICLIMFVLTLTFYLYSKRLEFLFYTLYVLFLFLYLTPDIFRLYELFFGSFGLASYTFFQGTQLVINLCYIVFVIFYLNTKKEYPKLHKALFIITVFLFATIIIDPILLTLKKFTLHIYLLDFERLVMSLFGIIGILYLLIKAKKKLAYFIVIGSLFYMIGALGFLFLNNRNYMIFGSVIEILIFASGLTYKIQLEYKEKIKFQKEAYTNKAKALRAQINPHFIFNSLSSIQSFITSNNKVSALKYLSKFSRLTRNILESSIETNVVLEDEIKMLKDYLELESLRFDKAFNYKIIVDDKIDTNAIEVPFMILQPFVENAIIHGLLPKKEGIKQLTLNFKYDNGLAICEIDDNGIGRIAAKENNHIHKENKKSRGIDVTMQRLEAINNENEEALFKIIDKVDNKNNALGTKIIIKIPA